MNFAGIGVAELALILIIALLIFGPAKLPQIAKDLGDTIRRWREAVEEMTVDSGGGLPASPSGEGEKPAVPREVSGVERRVVSNEVTTMINDEQSDAEEQSEEAEVKSECQT
jgi:sec-independent protein translocase protein TatA